MWLKRNKIYTVEVNESEVKMVPYILLKNYLKVFLKQQQKTLVII